MLQKIVLLGPESTGKSSLAEALAKKYDTIWCPEYARTYLEKNGSKYTYQDLSIIAKGQQALEDACVEKLNAQNKQDHKLFIDTDMYVMKVWSEYVFNNCDPAILEAINERTYALYLLCAIDLPWTSDEMREYPEQAPRIELFTIYKDLLINQSTPWGIVVGQGEERLANAVQIIDQYLG